MNLNFKPEEEDMIQMQEAFTYVGLEQAIFMSHYELEKASEISAEHWKKFLMHPKVMDFISGEMTMYKKHQLKNIIKNAKDMEKSVGVAQMINALNKTDMNDSNDNGETYIYCYVPLNEQEENAPNVHIIDHDIFNLGGSNET